MSDEIQCDNCGALLAPEDAFCGECGAPRPTLTTATSLEGAATPPTQSTPPFPPVVTRPSSPKEARWRPAFVALVVLGALTCLIGLVAFLLFGSISGEDLTPQENWLISALCCLLPIGGFGAILAAAGAIIWYTRLKDR